MMPLFETPMLAIARRATAALQRMRDHDLNGKDYDRMLTACAERINLASCDEWYALARLTCDVPAETVSDALVQLEAAAGLMELLTTHEDGLKAPEAEADCHRVERAITSAIRVLLEIPGSVVDETRRRDFAQSVCNRWKGDLPPVRFGGEE